MEEPHIHATLTSFFYDLVKAVPAGTINRILLNTIVVDEDGNPRDVDFCDDDLARYADSIAGQLLAYKTKFTRHELYLMGGNEFKQVVSCEEEDIK